VKYTTKAFRKAIWDDILIECRGLVLDSQDQILSYPFTKTFNLFEKGVGGERVTVDRDEQVTAVEKINGFLGVASYGAGFSTTGTLDSDYAKMAKEMIRQQCPRIDEMLSNTPNWTYMFEVVHPDDPHIVPEQKGAYLIGARQNYYGSPLMSEQDLDQLALNFGFLRPPWWRGIQFDTVKQWAKESQREGFVVRQRGKYLCKLKTDHYRAKKFLMRGDPEKIWEDEDTVDIARHVQENYTKEQWDNLGEQERRKEVEKWI
jgi:hypothetical protein